MSFGTVLKRRRQSRGMTQRELCAKIGMDHAYYSRIERNYPEHESPRTETILKFCDALRLKDWERLWLLTSAGRIDPELQSIVIRNQELPGFKAELKRLVERLKKKENLVTVQSLKEAV